MEEEKKEESTKEESTKKENIKEESMKEESVDIPEKFKGIVKEIEKMSVLDLSELVKILEKKFNVSANAPMAMAMPSAGGGVTEESAGEEKSSFNVELKAVGEKKIEVIKAVRDVTGKGLKEAKDLVDAAGDAPQLISENIKKEEAEELKKKFEAAGAQIELK